MGQPSKKIVGIVFSKNSKMPRRVVVNGDATTAPNIQMHVGVGEDGMIATIVADEVDEFLLHPQRLRKIVAKHHGIEPSDIPDDHCAIVHKETGMVTNLVKADPEYDLHPDGHVKSAPTHVAINDKHDGADYLLRHAVLINDEVHGFIWDTELHAELAERAVRDSSSNVGDKIVIPEMVNHPSEGVEEL